jgi:hypothetical protein
MKTLSIASCISISAFFLLAGCDAAPAEKPHETYNRYYKLVREGRTFEQDKAFYSKARQAEIMAKTKSQADRSGTAIEKLKDLYLNFTQRLAACGDLTLLKETIDGQRASLVYARKEICDDTSGKDGRELIEMVHEGGWKITSNETKM